MKKGQKGAWPSYFSNFVAPYISGMGKGTNLKFCMQIDHKGY